MDKVNVTVTYTDALGNPHENVTDDQETLNYLVENVIQHGERNKIHPWEMNLRIMTRIPKIHATRILFPVPYEGAVIEAVIHEN